MSSQHHPHPHLHPSADAPVFGTRRDEPHERLAKALTGVFGSFASSAAVAARLQQSSPRARALQQVATVFDDRHRAMQGYSASLVARPPRSAVNDSEGPERSGAAPVTHEPRDLTSERAARPLSVPLPVLKRDIGLGDAVKKLTSLFGFVACGACERRAAALNRTLMFRATPRQEK